MNSQRTSVELVMYFLLVLAAQRGIRLICVDRLNEIIGESFSFSCYSIRAQNMSEPLNEKASWSLHHYSSCTTILLPCADCVVFRHIVRTLWLDIDFRSELPISDVWTFQNLCWNLLQSRFSRPVFQHSVSGMHFEMWLVNTKFSTIFPVSRKRRGKMMIRRPLKSF